LAVHTPTTKPITEKIEGMEGKAYELSEVQAKGSDDVVKATAWDRATGTVTIPARTVAVLTLAQAAEAGPRVKRDPMRILITRYWGPLVAVTILALHNFETTIFSVWALSYGKAQGIAEAHMLSQTVLVQLSALAAIPLWTLLADKLGRKKIYIGGYIVVAVLLWFYMTQLHDANVIGVYLLGFVMQGIFYSAVNGVWPAFYGEQFPTKVRLSGTSLGTQIGFTITGFAPTIAAALVIGDATDFTPVYLLTIAVMAAVLLTAAFGTRETAFKSLDQLDEEADEAEVTKYGHSL